jgi:hypothetical protein
MRIGKKAGSGSEFKPMRIHNKTTAFSNFILKHKKNFFENLNIRIRLEQSKFIASSVSWDPDPYCQLGLGTHPGEPIQHGSL